MANKTTHSKLAKSVSEETKDEGQASLYQQILTKLQENKNSADSQYESLLQAINRINSRLDTLETEHKEFIDCMDFMSKEIKELQGENLQLKKTVAELHCASQNRQATDKAVTSTVDKLETEKNLKTLIVANIPESHHEDTVKVVTTLAGLVKADVKITDIETAFRLKNDSTSSKPPLIMVKFNNTSSQERLYNPRLNLHKNSITTSSLGLSQSNKIFINEALSKSQRSLFYKARSAKGQLGLRYIWTYHGSIFMRKSKETDAIRITTEEELSQLTANTHNHNG